MTAPRWTMQSGDCLPWLASLSDKSVDVVITDPPYSEHVHAKSRIGSKESKDGISQNQDLGFVAITPEQMAEAARQFARLARRWVLVFSDIESTGDWRRCLTEAGLDYVRTGTWVKLAATPQFSGDRPACATEHVTIAHPKGRKHWNGGGMHALWTHTIAQNRGAQGPRLHTTQKPLALMLELVSLFSEPGELVLDPFAGSGTTGVAALRQGRRFAGCELQPGYFATTCERLAAEEQQQSVHAARAGQTSFLGDL
jgi:DNA modification methylase